MCVPRTLVVLALAAGTAPGCGPEQASPERTAQGEQTDPVPQAARDATPPPARLAPQSWPPEEARRLEAGFAPTPYTADQIRRGCPSGLRAIYRMGGDSTTYQHFAFDKNDETGTDFSVTLTPERDTPLGERKSNRLEWSSLQRHANFPERSTVIEDETITVPAGTFACMRYTVTSIDDAKAGVGTYWFAYDLPGAPIKWIQKVDDVVVRSMELIHREVVK